jgi:diketogulonate reductase-like aldo/keto reductase
MRQMRESCHKYDIAIEPFTALAPLTRWPGGTVQVAAKEIAEAKGITAAQVLLAWARQMTGGPIVTYVSHPSYH